MNCAGSVAAEAVEPDEGSMWAAEGTVAHKVLEHCLRFGLDAHDFYGRKYVIRETDDDGNQKPNTKEFEITVDDEMVEFLQPVIDDILDTPGEHFYENRVSLDLWLPGQFGTLDVGILQPDRNRIIIRDLKYGRGLPVRAEDNAQLKIYAAGFWRYYAKAKWPKGKKPDFLIIIDQPRNEGGGGEWLISYDDLMDWMEDVAEAGARTYDENAPRTPGAKQCGYCKAAQHGHCRAYDKWNLKQIGAKFDHFQKGAKPPSLPEKMDPDVRARILDLAPTIKQWLARLHADAINDALAGRPCGGKKAIAGRAGIRAWANEEAALEFLDKHVPEDKSIYQPRKLLSPAGAEKVLGRKLLIEEPQRKSKSRALRPPLIVGELITQPPGKPTLVPESDPRPKIAAYKERFDEFSDDDGD